MAAPPEQFHGRQPIDCQPCRRLLEVAEFVFERTVGTNNYVTAARMPAPSITVVQMRNSDTLDFRSRKNK